MQNTHPRNKRKQQENFLFLHRSNSFTKHPEVHAVLRKWSFPEFKHTWQAGKQQTVGMLSAWDGISII